MKIEKTGPEGKGHPFFLETATRYCQPDPGAWKCIKMTVKNQPSCYEVTFRLFNPCLYHGGYERRKENLSKDSRCRP